MTPLAPFDTPSRHSGIPLSKRARGCQPRTLHTSCVPRRHALLHGAQPLRATDKPDPAVRERSTRDTPLRGGPRGQAARTPLMQATPLPPCMSEGSGGQDATDTVDATPASASRWLPFFPGWRNTRFNTEKSNETAHFPASACMSRFLANHPHFWGQKTPMIPLTYTPVTFYLTKCNRFARLSL